MTFKLYEFAVTRSSRVRFTLLELGLPFESIDVQHLSRPLHVGRALVAR